MWRTIWLSVCAAIMCGSASAQVWHAPGAPYRLKIQRAEASPGPATTGRVTVYAPGMDAARIYPFVVTTDGTTVGSTVLFAAAGEPVTLLFDSSGGHGEYYVYLSEQRPAMPVPWTPDAGLILETRELPSGAADRWDRAQKLWQAGSRVLGRSLVSQIFHGIHIHGPTSTFLSHYRGALEVKEAGEYRFAAMSESPSYLLINGRLVSQCAGWGALEAARRGDNAVKLKLNAGRHQLEYFHAQVGGTFIASVMWQTPGMKRPEILPASAFAPVAEFQTAAYESARLPLYAEWNVVAHNIHGGLAVVDMSFTARAAGQPVNEAVWKFDDGSSEKGTTVRHTFPRAGMRTVTLELGGKSLTFKVNVRPQWSREKDWSESLFGKQCADLLKRDFALMPLDDLLSLTRLARSVDHLELLSKCGLACLERHTEITGADVHVLRALADHFQNHRVREYATAEKCLRAALQSKSLDSATADRMRLSLADFLVQVTGQTTEALDLLKQIKTASLSGDDRRWHSLTEADARVALGQVDTARKLYELAAPGDDPRSVRQSVRRSVQLANADLYIQRGEFEVAEKIVADIWWNVPVERMSTAPGRMMLRVYKGRREFPRALTLCQRLLNVATLDNDRSELMLELIEILMTLKQDKDATEVLARLVADFPYSESAAIAKDRWAGKLALPAPKK